MRKGTGSGGWDSSCRRHVSALVTNSHHPTRIQRHTTLKVGAAECSISFSTPELSPEVEADVSLPRHGCLDLGSLWHDAGLYIPPERDEKAACQRDDSDAAHPALGLADTLAEPAAQRAARLVAQPQPSQLHHRGPEARVAGLGDSLFTVQAAALPRHRRQAGISRHLAPVAEAAICISFQAQTRSAATGSPIRQIRLF